MRSSNIKYLIGVDHLRAYAALLVVVYHVIPKGFDTHDPLKAILLQGNIGVALFMVLSGFIFTVGLLGKEINLKGFIQNRIIRIYPLYIFTLVAAMSAFPTSVTFDKIALSLLPFSNLPGAFHAHITQFGTLPAGLDPFTMSWTIAIELQFYLLFPFLLSLINRKRLKQLLYFWAAFALIRVFLIRLPGASDYFVGYYSIFGRLDQFILGMLGAYAFSTYRKKLDAAALWILTVSVLALGALCLVVNNTVGDLSVLNGLWSVILPPIFGVIFAGLIVSYVAIFERRKRVSWFSNAMSKLGELSYSVYLMHILVVIAMIRVAPRLTYVFGHSWFSILLYAVVFVIPVTLLVSFITYNGIERPFLELRKKYTKPAVPLKVAQEEL